MLTKTWIDRELIFLSLLILNKSVVLSFSLNYFLNKTFVFAILHFEEKVLRFVDKLMILARRIAITGATSLRKLAEI